MDNWFDGAWKYHQDIAFVGQFCAEIITWCLFKPYTKYSDSQSYEDIKHI